MAATLSYERGRVDVPNQSSRNEANLHNQDDVFLSPAQSIVGILWLVSTEGVSRLAATLAAPRPGCEEPGPQLAVTSHLVISGKQQPKPPPKARHISVAMETNGASPSLRAVCVM